MPELNGPTLDILDGEPLTQSGMLALDRLAAAAWPAPYQENLDGWALRYGDGVSRRANSVAPWPLIDAPRPMEQMMAVAQVFYEERGLPPRFQVSPAAEPDALDDILAANGYEIEAPVTMQIGKISDVAAAPSANFEVSDQASEDWWASYVQGFSRDAREIIGAAQDQPLFAAMRDEKGAIIGSGLAVLNGDWAGIFAMYTDPSARRQGVGTALAQGLAHAAATRSATGLYLQVENSNSAARELYRRLGFRAVYGYYYRTLWPQGES